MAPIENAVSDDDGPLILQPWPGYWRTKACLGRVKRFQDLIRHRENWAGEPERAQPLAELIEGDVSAKRLDEEIQKLQHLVFWDIKRYTFVQTTFHYGKRRSVPEAEEEKETYDVIQDYFRLPRGENPYLAYETLMGVLNHAIGIFEARKKRAFREIFIPIVWAAHFIRLPITIMERA